MLRQHIKGYGVMVAHRILTPSVLVQIRVPLPQDSAPAQSITTRGSADMMELADVQDLGSCAARRVGSNPTVRTTWLCQAWYSFFEYVEYLFIRLQADKGLGAATPLQCNSGESAIHYLRV